MLTPYTRQKAKFSFGEKTASLRRGEDEDKGKEEYDFSSAFTCRPLQEESMSVPIEKRGESTFPKMLRHLPFSLCFVWIGYQGSKLSQIGRTGLSFHYFNEVIDREGIFSM